MRIVTSPAEMRTCRKSFQRGVVEQTVGLVPTMGALHDGHLSLVRASRERCDRTVASIFVNPLQFGPTEDFALYPRTFDEDCAVLEREGVDLLFAPTPADMYPAQMQTVVDVPEIGSRLDGASRQGHFRGVATVVSKLFNIVQPDYAFFGQKDAAQVAVLRAMVRDLNYSVDVVVCPTVRESDGLAMSSRNRYLTHTEREDAQALSRSLREIAHVIASGQRNVAQLRTMLRQDLTRHDSLRVDYADLVDPETLESIEELLPETLVAVAAWVGETRLIDNCIVRAEEELL